MRPGQSFRFLITAAQRPKMERVVAHNGGTVLQIVETEDAIQMTVGKAPEV